MKISLSDHFTYKKLFKFTLPSILMMIFTSIYGVVDGFFVSNTVGKDAFVGVNLIMPFIIILGTLGFMFGSGGSALVSKTMGEGKDEKAGKIFSLLIYFSAALAVLLAVLAFIFMRKVAELLGASEDIIDYCVTYGRILVLALPFYSLQMEFHTFTMTAERPMLGFATTIAAGLTNIILDALLMGVFHLGIAGAAIATAISQTIGGVIPLIYFIRPNSSRLQLGKTEWDAHAIIKTCTNGCSEFVGNISGSITAMLYNFQLLKYAGESGVAAYGVLMYVNMVFIAIFIGYYNGTSPIVGYHYGAGNKDELKNLLRKAFIITVSVGAVMLILAYVLASPLAHIFVGSSEELTEFTKRAFSIFAISFPFCGIAIMGSGFFTSLNNGFISAVISFLRTVVFQIAAVMILPIFMGSDGIWTSIVATEFMAATLSIAFLIAKRKQYEYF
ncbi:MAG: MATE family efflux transporter [Clostridiales bacterium]|nr:MATE family efflux transporter [Clostridiales bacterium]